MKRITELGKKVKDIFCAIDLHQDSMLCGIAFDMDEPTFKSWSTDDEALLDFTSHILTLQELHPGSSVKVVYEASGCGFRLADVLEDHGVWVAVLAPTNLPQTVKSRRNKTDRNDCKALLAVLRAHVLAGNELPSVWIPPAQVRDDREIVRRRLDLKERSTDVKNAIHGLLRRYGIKRPAEFKTNWSKKHRAWLGRQVSELQYGAGVQLASLLRELEFFDLECDQLDREVEALAEQDRYRDKVKALTEMKGVGLLAAMVFLTELGDMDRFSNRKQTGSYLGLTARSYESGELNDRKGKISKLGPARVRKILNQVAWSAVKHDPYWNEWFNDHAPKDKKTGKRKLGKKYIVAVMRKLGIIMWHTAKAA